MEISELIKSVYPVSDETMGILLKNLRPRTVKQGETIIREGEVCSEVFFVLNGTFRNYSFNEGIEHTRWFAIDGDIFTSMFSYINDLPAMSSVDALTNSEVLVCDTPVARRLIEENHELAMMAYRYIAVGLSEMERRYTFLGRGDAYTRYSNLIKMRGTDTLNNIKLKYIASYLGMTPQTLSLVRSRIAKEGRSMNSHNHFPK